MKYVTIYAKPDILKPVKTIDDLKRIRDWLSGLNIKVGKAPPGMKKLLTELKFVQKQFDTIDEYADSKFMTPEQKKAFTDSAIRNINATLSRLTEEDINKIDTKLGKKEAEPDTIKQGSTTYINNSNLNFKKFKSLVSDMEGYLKKLKSFHKKVVTVKPLTIRFVKKDLSKTAAKYKQDKDEVWIRPDSKKIIKGDGYASFYYVLVHELGHRYDYFIKQKTDFDKPKWYTTKYSRTDSIAGSESFAELFALSHFGVKKYPEYEKQIKEFLDKVTK